MSGPILRLFGLIVVLFALLLAWTTRWTVIDSKALRNNGLNKRTLVDELKIKRGRILADDGTVLARSLAAPDHTWTRGYPTHDLFSQSVGYSIAVQGRDAGLERSRGEELRGLQTGLSSIFGQLSSRRVGDDVYTTLDPKAQRVAVGQLAAASQLGAPMGSVVAIDPRSGAVKVMASLPSYDDNHPDAPGSTTYDRSTQSGYPPGSTFKVVTATAAIDSGKYTPGSTVNGNSPVTISGVLLRNDNNQSFGTIDLTTALTYSVNTVWSQVAESVGRPTMTRYMQRFGFYAKPPLDLPPGELSASHPVSSATGRPFEPGSRNEDIGRIGIGQGGLEVTPLQMAMVASALANGGKLMTPHLTSRVVDQDGRNVETINPSVYAQVMKPSTAQQVGQMMTQVVKEGTGTAVALSGITVAGKTGTAQVGTAGSNLTQPWFIAYAPVERPRIAIAVTVERTQGGFGGTVAAPIAKAVLQTLLAETR
ncbi:MAG: peptidoglycan D,D-transpeptidase FtsI family protein [Solirubrobacteraceae bacterium]